MALLIITNNPLVYNKYSIEYDILFQENSSIVELLIITRDNIHQGALLITHPLSGSVKPNETPFKTILIDTNRTTIPDLHSLAIIENAIIISRHMAAQTNNSCITERISIDFQCIDFNLISSGIESAKQYVLMV